MVDRNNGEQDHRTTSPLILSLWCSTCGILIFCKPSNYEVFIPETNFNSACFLPIFFLWLNRPQWARGSPWSGLQNHTPTRHTETHHNRQNYSDQSVAETHAWQKRNNFLYRTTSLFQVGFEPTNSASERPQTHSLDRVSSGISFIVKYKLMQKTVVLKIQTQHIYHRILFIPGHVKHTCLTCISES